MGESLAETSHAGRAVSLYLGSFTPIRAVF